MKLLLIEDDKKIVSFLKRGLNEDGFKLDIAQNAEDGEYLAIQNNYDVIILDWMLPDGDGLEILQKIRKEKSTPIIMLTAKDKLKDKLSGLRNGADDYITKPFEYDELVARIEVLYRRNFTTSNIVKLQDLKIDLTNKIVTKNNSQIKLTKKEYELFVFLLKNKNNFISTDMIENDLWNNEKYINSNVISVTIYHLRQKIGKDIIKSSKGFGYKIEV